MRSEPGQERPSRVLRLVYFGPAGSVHTIRWLSEFVSMGHEVHFITEDIDSGRTMPGVIVHDMSVTGAIPRPARFLLRWLKVRRILSEVDPDVVHGHYVATGGYAAFFGHRPLVMTAWGSDVLVAPRTSRWQRSMARWRLRRCDVVTVDSEDLKRAVMNLGVTEEKIELIQWGVDLDGMSSVRGDRTLREVLNVPPDGLVVLSTRRFEPIYDLESIIRAIPHVAARTKRMIVFVFAGGGSLLQELQSLAESCRVIDRVRFMGDLPQGELAKLYGGADVYVSVPLSDSTSVSLLEALAAGLPVVVSDLPSNREWIRHERNGYVVPPQDPLAIADAVLRLASDEETLREFGERNLHLAAAKADRRTHMRRMEQIYHALLDNKDRSHRD